MNVAASVGGAWLQAPPRLGSLKIQACRQTSSRGCWTPSTPAPKQSEIPSINIRGRPRQKAEHLVQRLGCLIFEVKTSEKREKANPNVTVGRFVSMGIDRHGSIRARRTSQGETRRSKRRVLDNATHTVPGKNFKNRSELFWCRFLCTMSSATASTDS